VITNFFLEFINANLLINKTLFIYIFEIMLNKNDDFYQRLEKQLADSSVWPSIYKFKFILKSSSSDVNFVKNLFKDINTEISSNISSSKNYTSITITATMKSPNEIIQKYKLASQIDGIISL
tara:strand:- start:2382 stop:2747 length:366 start_codon:yes stop_codon:yes gene_type:complete